MHIVAAVLAALLLTGGIGIAADLLEGNVWNRLRGRM